MTVQTEFWNWQTAPMQPWPGRCAPIATTWMGYLLDRWGGQNVGCIASRPVVGGSSPSTHASGAAIDWRYQDPGIGRSRMLNEIMPGLLNLSRDLGVTAVHDYVGCRIWRPPGTSGRPTSPSPECGWRQQTPGSQMGQSWALWLHIECLNTRWSDTRTVDQMLAASGGGSGGGPTPEPEDEVTDQDIERIATRAAQLVWAQQVSVPQGGTQPYGWVVGQTYVATLRTVAASEQAAANTRPT